MSRQPPRDHPWRSGFPEDRLQPKEIPQLTAAEISAAKLMRFYDYKWASIARILDCPVRIVMKAMSPNYKPLEIR